MLFPSFIKAIMKSCFPDLSGQEPACALLTPGLDYCAWVLTAGLLKHVKATSVFMVQKGKPFLNWRLNAKMVWSVFIQLVILLLICAKWCFSGSVKGPFPLVSAARPYTQSVNTVRAVNSSWGSQMPNIGFCQCNIQIHTGGCFWVTSLLVTPRSHTNGG